MSNEAPSKNAPAIADGKKSPNDGGNKSQNDLEKRTPRARVSIRTFEQSINGAKAAKKKPVKIHIRVSRAIVENKYFVGFTTILTMWALLGDDMRRFTHKSADPYFDAIVYLCLVVFSIEIVVSCLGKHDYYLGFFFWLDVVSTGTLVLDLSAVAELVAAGNSDPDEGQSGEQLKSGRTARVGAKAGRLVRILKLYKAFYESRARKRAAEEKKALEGQNPEPQQDDEWDESEIEENEEARTDKDSRESRVGKKLSEMTTRRVIFLILSSLVVPNFIAVPDMDQHSSSPMYGAITVQRRFEEYLENRSTREDYQLEMMRMIVYHNWFDSCPDVDVFNACGNTAIGVLFYVAAVGRSEAEVAETAKMAQLDPSFVEKYKGYFPKEILPILTSSWNENCDSDTTSRRGFSLLSNEVPGVVDHEVDCPADLRGGTEYLHFGSPLMKESSQYAQLRFYFDMRELSRTEATNNIGITAVVCALLLVASLLFSNDANVLVLHPVENMVRRVEAIRDNPLIAMKMADEEFKAEEMAKARLKNTTRRERITRALYGFVSCKGCGTTTNEPMETMILEKTIIKLGSLLALGFGEAGANIIGANMMGSDSAGVNAMIPGVRVDCIIGIARVRDFSTATEVLQAKIMKFVNQISEIVHGVVDGYHGAANKNYGEFFLIIWQFSRSGVVQQNKQRIAEMSVCAFARALAAVHRSTTLASYRGHPGLQLRLGSRCRVHMSFGLHSGWAIEGAVGSEFKIDASYLSPNVSIARSVEAASLTYGVPLVVAQSVVMLCSKKLVDVCRLIDRVIITGSPEPMSLYSLDMDYMSLSVENYPPLKVTWTTRQRFRARQFLEVEKGGKLSEQSDLANFLHGDQDFLAMRKVYTTEFTQLFNMGFQNYSQGEWQVARRMLSCTRTLLGTEDGPSTALLHFMEVPFQFEAPEWWTGIRELKENRESQADQDSSLSFKST
eukprot:TRINITY_DN24245_c0_g1_i1.p1 TRINITY_DN24245_c0_g1~~TRINITY_DN24245_c0_g1_i1.p1  ORF type:complete len:956 (+),score=167.15 TRINITY_DN24245_c0_g1_i1:203-3070(+)